MGYTHSFYWNKAPKQFDNKILPILQAIVKDGIDNKVIQYEFDSDLPPVCDNTEIRFNGIGEDGLETFFISAERNKDSGNFCKTAKKPYDKYVAAILWALKEYYTEDLRLKSDGAIPPGEELEDNPIEPEWIIAINFYNEILSSQ